MSPEPGHRVAIAQRYLVGGRRFDRSQRLFNLGLVEETTHKKAPDEQQRRRRFYQLTDNGRAVFQMEIERMKGVLRRVRLSRMRPLEQAEE